MRRKLAIGASSIVAGIVLFCSPSPLLAHERFVKHELLNPLQRDFFRRLDPNMISIAARVFAIMSVLMLLWFCSDRIFDWIQKRFVEGRRGFMATIVDFVSKYVFDRPIEARWFTTLREWSVIFFLRCPALVLMYSAANDSLVMPSYPLDPSTALFFKYAQVIMAVGIITQAFLPFGGATIIGTMLYLLYAYDWKIVVDVLPILTVAVIYVSAPWASHKVAITDISEQQMRWLRIILGFGFFALGWMKIYNHDLTAGVADQYPSVREDPLILMFYIGTDSAFARESWILGFALSEVMTGALIMLGVFNRVWSTFMLYIFTKLMLVDFGWAEIPHLYPIGAFLVVAVSNSLTSELGYIDDPFRKKARAEGAEFERPRLHSLGPKATVAAFGYAFAIVFPMLWFLTLIEHP